MSKSLESTFFLQIISLLFSVLATCAFGVAFGLPFWATSGTNNIGIFYNCDDTAVFGAWQCTETSWTESKPFVCILLSRAYFLMQVVTLFYHFIAVPPLVIQIVTLVGMVFLVFGTFLLGVALCGQDRQAKRRAYSLVLGLLVGSLLILGFFVAGIAVFYYYNDEAIQVSLIDQISQLPIEITQILE